jgi:SAM-dependent methyltransferase
MHEPIDQRAVWNARYQGAGDDYLFGTEPNRFLARRAALFADGTRALCIADGEGRNSVWLAQQGLAVCAVEISPVAVHKARRMAAAVDARIDFVVADMLAPDWPPAELVAAFDWVIGIFVQFVGPAQRERQFEVMKRATRPGGRILLQGYTPAQIEYGTGGPSAVENLYTAALLREAFADWTVEELVEYEDDIAEGLGHKGRSALVGFIARKPA